MTPIFIILTYFFWENQIPLQIKTTSHFILRQDKNMVELTLFLQHDAKIILNKNSLNLINRSHNV